MNNSDNLAYVLEICNRYSYEKGTFEALKDAYNAIFDNDSSREIFVNQLSRYENDNLKCHSDYLDMLDKVTNCSIISNTNTFTCHLLILILMSKHMHELYVERNIPEEVFYDSLADLKWKLNECIRMHHVFGIFVAHWDVKIFNLEIFALGRLQFEPRKLGKYATVCGIELTPESNVIGVHIPSSGKLVREEYLESYARAEKFFSYMPWKDGFTIFECNSWLLFPELKVMLDKSSGIRRFSEDYSLIDAAYSKPNVRPWPVFYEKKNAPADELPMNTTLERAYVERYKKGLPSGTGHGIIVYKDGKILNTEKDKMV